MNILITLSLTIIPLAVMVWAIYSNKSNKLVIIYPLSSALVFGGILQFRSGGHPHVPGSEIIIVVLEFLFITALLILYFGVKYVYKKYKNT